MAKQQRSAQPASGARNRNAAVNQEMGITNLMPVSNWSTWSGGNIPEGTYAVGRDPLAPNQDELVFMLRRDGQARAMLSLLTLPIRAAFAQGKWIAPPGGGGEAETQFANDMWSLPSVGGGMKIPSSMFLRQTLLGMAHGFSAFEVVRKIGEPGTPLENKLVIDKMGYRDPRTVQFLTDDHGNFEGFRQVTSFAGRRIDVTIPAKDAWYWAANEEENPLYGVSFFESAFQHYQMKRKMYYIAHLAAQFAAVPGRIGEIPLGASPRQVSEFKAALANFAFNTAMATPPNFKVEAFNGNSGFDFLKLIDHHNLMMVTSILAKFLQQEDRVALIDNGGGDASADLFIQLLAAVTSELSDSWSTQLMPQFIDANFNSKIYPVFQFGPLTQETRDAILSLFTALVGLQTVNCTPEFVRTTEMKLAERLGYDIDYNKVADEEEQAAKDMQEQAAQEAQQVAQQQTQGSPQSQGQSGYKGTGAAATVTGKQGGKLGTPGQNNSQTGGTANRLPSAVKATAKQQAAMDTIALALTDLIDTEDVPAEFSLEEEVLPETGEE